MQHPATSVQPTAQVLAQASTELSWALPLPQAFASGTQSYPGIKHSLDRAPKSIDDTLLEELPVSLEFSEAPSVEDKANGAPAPSPSAMVMMATPLDLEDFALGFALSEGLIDRADQMLTCDALPTACGVGVMVTLSPGLLERVQSRQRDRVAATSCGLCGIADMQAALRAPKVTSSLTLAPASIHVAYAGLPALQRLGAATGAAHAAAFVDVNGVILAIAEDAGRHNALDKLIGQMAKRGLDPAQGWCAITSRASFEMVQKAAQVGFPLLTAISAPTGLAVRLAQTSGLSLIAFARDGRFTCFSHPERLKVRA